MCTRTEEEVDPRSGSQRHRHFVWFFNVPVQALTRDHPFYGYSETPPHFSHLLQHAWGYGGPIRILHPKGSHREDLLLQTGPWLVTFSYNVASARQNLLAISLGWVGDQAASVANSAGSSLLSNNSNEIYVYASKPGYDWFDCDMMWTD